MLKKLGVVIPSVVLTLLMAVGFSTPAFAYVEPEVKEEPVQVIEEEEPTEEEKIPFTMRGILNQSEFDEELVHELIKKIYVGMDNSVEVEFKCSDPYQEVLAIMSEVQNE